ncbi:hypothetical protein DACRYDRAFT_116381 [Dacryopinax primogenitus]|uniref:Uncharacterized protein n=1 Tax=Dacryopinax primogenitus (strain DJM 731) TaxID=1858805 RepID=M5GCU9_DACPD|nr:uncharacterized protein DACRYDRAFT_116381 [Dacryopinax primogenitus]EJU01983.1 hypothetical protein DACRYDRAFT_116381 [Dacryopinax primogenitus]
MASNAPPPEYTLSSHEEAGNASAHPATADSPSAEPAAEQLQVIITPTQNATDFQNGALGIEGEHATIEGEVQIKGAQEGAWQRVSITFQTVENSPEQTVELGNVTQDLYVRAPPSASSSTTIILPLPSSLPFVIPLQADTPECVHTPSSSLSHYLIVALLPTDPLCASFERKIPIHLRRYSTASAPLLPTLPYELKLADPVPFRIQLPRLEFRVGEPIPVYITIPPPDRQHLNRIGLRLRNIKAELVRVVALIDDEDATTPKGEQGNSRGEGSSSTNYTPYFSDRKQAGKDGWPDLGSGSSSSDGLTHTAVMSRSGAACRFHSTRSVNVRLVLHPFSLSAEVTASGGQPRMLTQDQREAEGCASITQTTLLHAVSFYLLVRVGFISSTGAERGEVNSEQTVPITMLPGLAPIEEDVTASQYSKKHDAPPERTYRYDYDAAPSGSGQEDIEGAAPPFTAYDGASGGTSADLSAPPPFFSDIPGTPRPPSFIEAQTTYSVGPSTSAGGMSIAEWSTADPNRTILRIPGEGEQFGFSYEDIYDGFGDGSRTPPPPLSRAEVEEPPPPPPEISLTDVDVSSAEFSQILNQTTQRLRAMLDTANGVEAPPPPPAMDDPLDPPPAIDDAYRPVMPAQHPLPPPVTRQTIPEETASPATPPPPHEDASRTNMHRGTEPPPYLVQAVMGRNPHRQSLLNTDQQDGHGPPPYSDFAGGPPT